MNKDKKGDSRKEKDPVQQLLKTNIAFSGIILAAVLLTQLQINSIRIELEAWKGCSYISAVNDFDSYIRCVENLN